MARVSALVLALWAIAPIAARAEQSAQDAQGAQAREEFNEGVRRMRAGDWARAEEHFRASYEMFPTQSALFNLGSALRAQDRHVDALEVFERFLTDYAATASEDELAEVRRMRDETREWVCTVRLVVSPPDAVVTVDGRALGPGDPGGRTVVLSSGEHRFAATLEGHAPEQVTRELDPGCFDQVVQIRLHRHVETVSRVEPSPGTPEGPIRVRPRRRRADAAAIAGWVFLGLAGAAALSASISGGVVLSLRQEFGQMTGADDWEGLQDQGRSLALTTDLLFGIAAAVGAVSVPLLVYGTRHREERER